MSLREYFFGKTGMLCAAGIGGIYLFLTGYLCGLPMSFLGLFFLCAAVGLFLGLLFGWRRADRRLKTLRKRMEALPEKYLIGEIMEKPADAVEREYFELMREISRSAISAVEQAEREKEDYYHYVESWVHELKTPLTAASLILSNGGDTMKLRRELRRADNLTETILTYAKLKTAGKDTRIDRAVLSTLCGQAVREEMELLIAAEISVSIEGDSEVYTDAARFVFILKQLLINCAKYCKGGRIRMDIADGVLRFSDDGPGIAAHELERITERGFTGTAGRRQGQSTGMGLYIVRCLCETLNIMLTIRSKEGKYTEFSFCFPAPTLQNCEKRSGFS